MTISVSAAWVVRRLRALAAIASFTPRGARGDEDFVLDSVLFILQHSE